MFRVIGSLRATFTYFNTNLILNFPVFHNFVPMDGNNGGEKKLLNKLKEGDPQAFKAIYSEYINRVKRFLKAQNLGEHIEDVAQETFIALWRNKSRLDPDKSLANYIFAIAKNFALKEIEKKLKNELLAENLMEASNDEEEEPEKQAERLRFIISQLDKLPFRQKQILSLKYLEGFSGQEIAEKLDLSKSTVENHLNRGLSALRAFFSK